MPSVAAEAAWNAVMTRDRRFDGTFVYGVSTTHIYCRPSCPSRRPARNHVTLFRSPQQAEAAGFRSCLRCRPRSTQGSRTDQLIEQARCYLDEHADEPVSLGRLAGYLRLSPSHLQRLFRRTVGLSPKAYQDARKMDRFVSSLKRGETVTTATYDAGFGSSSRLSQRASGELGMTPSVFRSGGAGVTLRYATVPTPVGLMLIAVTARGIAAVSFGDCEVSSVARLRQDYPKAVLRRDPQGLIPHIRVMLHHLKHHVDSDRVPVDIKGTAFQRKVWRALQEIPRGSTRSYLEIARTIGRPAAVRAVARACAANPIALAIPCHRAVRHDGTLAGYRWGLKRKGRLLELERSGSDAVGTVHPARQLMK